MESRHFYFIFCILLCFGTNSFLRASQCAAQLEQKQAAQEIAQPHKVATELGLKMLFEAMEGALTEEALEQYLKQGADVNAKDKNGITTLIFASAKGQANLVQQLVAAGAEVNAKTKKDDTALLLAAWNGREAVVKKLIAAPRIQIDAQSGAGSTALILAAWKGYTNIVQLLINAHANLNIQNEDGDTALIRAAEEKHQEAAELLINAGADLNHQNKNHQTALISVARNNSIKIAEKLIKAHAQLNITQPNSGHNALIIAALNGHTEIVRLLAKAGAELNAKIFHNGSTALIFAVRNYHPETVKALIEAGADVNAKDEMGYSALMYIGPQDRRGVTIDVGNDYRGILKDLIDGGADVNGKGMYTPLMQVATKRPELVQQLVAAGADPSRRMNGRTAYDKAYDKEAFNKAVEAGLAEWKERLELYDAQQKQAKKIVEEEKQLIPNISDIITGYAYGESSPTDLPESEKKESAGN